MLQELAMPASGKNEPSGRGVHLHAEHPLSYRNAVFPSLCKDLEYGVSNIRHETAGGRDGAA